MKIKKRTKLKATLAITILAGVTFAYFLFLTWKKLTEWIGDTNIVWGLTGALVLVFIFTGYFSFEKIAKYFTK